MKGRVVPSAQLVRSRSKRATLPNTDLALSDGRVLHYAGFSPWRQAGPGTTIQIAWWRCADGMAVGASTDRTPHGQLLHVSISYTDHNPSWDDIKAVRAAFYPSAIDVMMVLPQEQHYVNAHEHCFHLWQTPVAWGIQ